MRNDTRPGLGGGGPWAIAALLVGLASALAARGEELVITTVAGGGPGPGPALGAPLGGTDVYDSFYGGPSCVISDGRGNLFVCAGHLNRVVKVDAQGQLRVIAGNGVTPGFAGDGGPATDAELANPVDAAVDTAGNLFICDSGSQRIRRVDATSGTISTVAGNGVAGYGGDGGPATAASLHNPNGIAVDLAGNLFIADSWNHRIRRVDRVTGTITTIAGTGQSGFEGDNGPAVAALLSYPSKVALDGAGNVYLTEWTRVRRIDAATGTIATFAGNGTGAFAGDGGPARSASLWAPNGLAFDASGNLFIADSDNWRVRRVDAATSIITTIAGNGLFVFDGDDRLATTAALWWPNSVAVDSSGNVLIADLGNHRVRRVAASNGLITTVAGGDPCWGCSLMAGDRGPATSATLDSPFGLAIESDGQLLIADTGHWRVRRFDPATGSISTAIGAAEAYPRIATPYGVASIPSGGVMFTNTAQNLVQRYEPLRGSSILAGTGERGLSGDGGPATAATLNLPYAVIMDATGNAFIADWGNDRIRRVDALTGVMTSLAGGAVGGIAFALDESGGMYVADPRRNRIFRIELATGLTKPIAGDGTEGFAGDGGPALTARLARPEGIAIDGGGNLYVTDTFNHRIRYIDVSSGVITTIAGNGQPGFSGDGGPARDARFRYPQGLAFDRSGNLFVADQLNNRVRKLRRNPKPMAFFTIAPCRAVDTREAPGSRGGPALGSGAHRTFDLAGACDIPATARAVSFNVTVTEGSSPGDLRLYAPWGLAPLASVINYGAGQTRAVSAVAPLGLSGAVTVRSDQAGGSVQVILDVNGYFE